VLTVQQAIETKTHVPLSKLVMTQRDAFDGLHYAHAWSFVHFLQNTPKYQKSFTKYFKDLYGLELKDKKPEIIDTGWGDKSGVRRRYKAEDVRDALLARLGVKDVDALEREWVAYVTGLKIDAPRARFLRGYEEALWGEDAKKALADLDAGIEGGYRHPEAYWARAYARLRTSGPGAAVEDFRRAVELDPLDAVYRADLAWGLTGWWGKESEKVFGTPEQQDEAAAQFGLAAELDPENEFLQALRDEFAEARRK
jgi:tetratricopeptide (TPR) repeat protein